MPPPCPERVAGHICGREATALESKMNNGSFDGGVHVSRADLLWPTGGVMPRGQGGVLIGGVAHDVVDLPGEGFDGAGDLA